MDPKNNTFNFNTPNREKLLSTSNYDATITNKSFVIGQGSFGIVLRASYRGKNVAVKILEKETSKIFKYDSLKQEANILNLNHENIVKIFKIIESRKFGAIIMEILDGYSLQFIIDQYQIDLINRIWIALDLSSALTFCHENNIIHSDVKPKNIIVVTNPLNKSTECARRYICKLFDFGCSLKFLDQQDIGLKCGNGTLRYMAPELLQGLNNITPAVDIYSYGIILWQLKERKYPYENITNNDFIVFNVVTKQLRPNTTILKDIPNFCGFKSCKKIPTDPKNVMKFQENFSVKFHLFRKNLFDVNSNPKSFQQLFKHKTEPMQNVDKIESEYVELYEKCWSHDPNKRPTGEEIQKILKKYL